MEAGETATEFLKAQLGEDEAAAKAAADCGGHVAPGWAALTDAAGTGWIIDAADPDSYAITTDTLSEIAVHIARHDPARVLREVAAKRAILAEHGPLRMRWIESHSCSLCRLPYPCATIRAILAVYADRPDYDPAWT